MGYVTDDQLDGPIGKKFRDAAECLIDQMINNGDTSQTGELATLFGLLSHYRAVAAEAIGWKSAAERHLDYLERRVEELEARERVRTGESES